MRQNSGARDTAGWSLDALCHVRDQQAGHRDQGKVSPWVGIGCRLGDDAQVRVRWGQGSVLAVLRG